MWSRRSHNGITVSHRRRNLCIWYNEERRWEWIHEAGRNVRRFILIFYHFHTSFFSASDLLSLSIHPSVSSSLLAPLPSPTTVVQSILNRSIILIPYDCDRNHEPSLRKGVAAHWAVIVSRRFYRILVTVIFQVGVLVISTESGDLSPFPDDLDSIISDLTADRLFVLAYHGKSK